MSPTAPGHPPPLICLITPGHVASTPRLVKNADALAEAGYRVHVVAGRHYAPVDALDARIFDAARWSHTLVDYRSGAMTWWRKLLRRGSRAIAARTAAPGLRLAAFAHHAQTLRLAAVAGQQTAKLYLGHCLAGLPAAALAAKRRNTAYGFDAEDFHDADTTEATTSPVERAARRALHAGLLPGCALFTAASPLIARRYTSDYGVEPLPLLNVFPLAHAPATLVEPPQVSSDRPAIFYWFSQTVGPGRGLEAVIRITARMRTPTEIRLRGFVAPNYQRHLQALAIQERLPRMPVFLPPGPPDEMVRLAAEADLGLSTEERLPPNRDLCLTNKIFVYLLAGVPQLLSPTAAQAELAPALGNAVLLEKLDQIDTVAAHLDAFFAAPAQVAAARRRAWQLARERYCWEKERHLLLGRIEELLGTP